MKVKHSHAPDKIRKRLAGTQEVSYLRDFIYGAIDGAVTTFAVVSSVAAAGLSSGVIILLGLANLLADGFSMAVGNYLGVKAENDHKIKVRAQEKAEILDHPEGEKEEVRQIYAAKGFEGELLEEVVEVITANEERWLDTMVTEEHGLALQNSSAWKAAIVTFIAFLLIGAIPLSCFIVEMLAPNVLSQPFLASSILTGFAFFLIGSLKAVVLGGYWVKEGLETLFIGSIAAGIAFSIGLILKPLIQ